MKKPLLLPALQMLAVLASGATLHATAADCGKPGTMTGTGGVTLQVRVFDDGSIAVRAPLAVNPDGGPASYTVGDHGFTYIANGLALWRGGRRESCKAECMASFRQAEAAGFAAGTAEFCVFAMEIEPLQPGQALTKCAGGVVAGNGKGRPAKGAMLATLAGDPMQGYISTTSLQHLVGGKPQYLNAEQLPVAVAPDVKMLGKLAWVDGRRVGLGRGFALIGDKGPAFGEGSIALHQLLRDGAVSVQKTGPIAVSQRCTAAETSLRPPFQSRPDGGSADRCRPGRTATTASDVRAYIGIDQPLDFVVLGKAALPRKGAVMQAEVSSGSMAAAAADAGYSAEKLQQMLACLAS